MGADRGPGSRSNVSTFCKSRSNRGAPQVSISDLSTEPRPTKLIIQIVFREKASLLLYPDHKIKMRLCLKSAAKRKKWKQKFTLSLSDVTAVKLFFSVLLPWAQKHVDWVEMGEHHWNKILGPVLLSGYFPDCATSLWISVLKSAHYFMIWTFHKDLANAHQLYIGVGQPGSHPRSSALCGWSGVREPLRAPNFSKNMHKNHMGRFREIVY